MRKTELVDINTVRIDRDLPQSERIAEYVRQIKDPYHYISGKFNVTEKHPEIGATFTECLINFMN